MTLMDEQLEMTGEDVTLYTVTHEEPDDDYGSPRANRAATTIKAWIATGESLNARGVSGFRGLWTDADRIGIVKSTQAITRNKAYIDDGSDKWDVVEVFDVKMLTVIQYKLLRLERRRA